MAQFDRRQYIVRRADMSMEEQTIDVPNLNLAAGGNYVVNVYAPDGTICNTQVGYVDVVAPVGATSGTHQINIRTSVGILYCKTAFNKKLSYESSQWDPALSDTLKPNSVDLMGHLMRNVVFDSHTPLVFQYYNNTDVLQAGRLVVKVVYGKQVI